MNSVAVKNREEEEDGNEMTKLTLCFKVKITYLFMTSCICQKSRVELSLFMFSFIKKTRSKEPDTDILHQYRPIIL